MNKDQNDEYIKIGLELASNMADILFNATKSKSPEAIFKISTIAFSSLLAAFVDTSIKKEHIDKKIDLLKDIFITIEKLIHSKALLVKSNKKEKH